MDKKNKIFNLNYFGNVTTRYCEPKKGKKITFHDTIEGDKDFIFNFFESQPYYNELMPIIIKNNRGTHFYKKIIKKGLEAKSDFFKTLIKAIQSSENDISPKIVGQAKSIKYYKIPKLELLKRRKEKIDNYLINKNKTTTNKFNHLKKNNSMFDFLKSKNQVKTESIARQTFSNNTLNDFNFNNSKYNFLNNEATADTFHTNNNKNESMVNFHNKYTLNKKISSFYITRKNINASNQDNKNKSPKKFKIIKYSHLENLLNKCNEGINFAQNMGEDVGKSDTNKSIEEVNKKLKDVLKNKDQKVIEDKGSGNKKYLKLEKEKINELKRKMDIKVSDNYAYINRKELNDFMRDNDTIYAYQIYLREMNTINERIAKKKEMEKKNISTVRNLLENTFRQKEFLKYQIDKYYTKNAKKNELKFFNSKNKEDFYLNKNNDKDNLKGTILPKLFELKNFCYGRPNYNPMAGLGNNYND